MLCDIFIKLTQPTANNVFKHYTKPNISIGVPEHLIILIKSLHTKQEAAVRMEYGNTEWFEVRKGVRQGCILSPY